MTNAKTPDPSASPASGALSGPDLAVSPIKFPARVAAMDVGSNAIRFIAAEFVDPSHFVTVERLRVPVRLGHSAFLTGELTAEGIDAAVSAFASFRRHIDTLGVQAYRAVATSAVRESRNGGELVRRILRESGIRLETITGSEEARLVWLAVQARMPVRGRPWILADLGGGSLEISVVTRDGIRSSDSHTVGTVRLLEDLGGAEAPPSEFYELLREYAGALRIAESVREEQPAGLLATGGNIEALAELAGVEPDERGVSCLPLAELQRVTERLVSLSYRERIDRLGLREDRADVIVPAAVVYEHVARALDINAIHVPHVGVKEGLLLDLVDDLATHRVHVDRQEQEVYAAAIALGQRYGFDEAHGRQVAFLALALFDQLAELHGLGEEDRRMLLAAALLHDIGQFVSYRKHHKHSLYLIRHSELPTFSPETTAVVGLIARYHRRAEPKDHHRVWRDLEPEVRRRVQRLASLLRVADALDRDHLQRVKEVRADVDGEAVRLHLRARGRLLLEQWALEKKAAMFERTFQRRLQPTIHPADGAEAVDASAPSGGVDRE